MGGKSGAIEVRKGRSEERERRLSFVLNHHQVCHDADADAATAAALASVFGIDWWWKFGKILLGHIFLSFFGSLIVTVRIRQ